MTVLNEDFTVEHSYDATPARVFAAWTDPRLKRRWFVPDWAEGTTYELDVREGGRELLDTTTPDGQPVTYAAQYVDVVADERLVYLTEMHMGGRRIAATLAVMTLEVGDDRQTHLTLTEHGAYLDGLDEPRFRREGTADQLERIASALAEVPAGS